MTSYHPRPEDERFPFVIQTPSIPTALSCWHDSNEVACVIPDGAMPGRLNGIDILPWSAAVPEWEVLAGARDLPEPPFLRPEGMAAAAGVIIVEDDGRVWLVAPTNQFGGYAATFPKGRVDPGGELRPTAVREAFEESGLKVRIASFLIDVRRRQTYTRYYIASRVGGTPADMGWESQAVLLVPLARLRQLATNQNDEAVIAALEAWHKGRKSTPLSPRADTIPEAVDIPFLSIRTLAEDYLLVAELPDGVAVYQHINGEFATIGTRGHRPSDGSAGLIVHDHVGAKSPGQGGREKAPRFGPCHLSHWRVTKSPIATLLNVLDQHNVILLE